MLGKKLGKNSFYTFKFNLKIVAFSLLNQLLFHVDIEPKMIFFNIFFFTFKNKKYSQFILQWVLCDMSVIYLFNSRQTATIDNTVNFVNNRNRLRKLD